MNKLNDIFIPQKKIHSILFFGIIIFISLCMLLGLLYLETDSNIVGLLPRNKTTIEDARKIAEYKKEFPSSDNSVFLAVDFGEMTQEKFTKLKELNDRLENLEIDGVKYVSSILSPFNSIYFKKVGNTFTVKNFLTEQSFKNFQKVLDEAGKSEVITGAVLAYNKKSVAMLVNMNEEAMVKKTDKKTLYHYIGETFFHKSYEDEPLKRTQFCKAVNSVLDEYRDVFDIYVAGVGIYEEKSEQYIVRDIVVLIAPAILMIIIALFLNFRSKRGTLLPLAGILLSLLWTMGAMSWSGTKLSVVGIVIPLLILTVGSSYTLHYLNAYYLHAKEKDKRKLISETNKAIFPTIGLAALTTAIGFASFFTSQMKAMRTFGFWIIMSILLTVFFTFFLLSKLLYSLVPPEDSNLSNIENDKISKLLNNLTRFLMPPYNKIWIAFFAVVIILFGMTVKNLKIETNTLGFFKKNDNVKNSMIYLQENYHGTIAFNVTLKTQIKDFFRTREGLEIAERVQKVLDDREKNGINGNGEKVLGWSMSTAKMLREINAMMHDYDENELNKIPEDENLTNRLFRLLQISIKTNPAINGFINKDLSMVNFQIRTYSDNSAGGFTVTERDVSALTEDLNRTFGEIEKELNGKVKIEVWGETIQLSKLSKYLLQDQISSIFFTLILIFISVMIVFKSIYFAAHSLVPLVFGILMNFIIMSVAGIPLDIATILISSIVMGIGIDDSIHFLLTYKNALKSGLNSKEAIVRTFSLASRPIFFTTVSMVAGFLVFLLSTFRPIYYFGLLIAISMVNCTFASLFILPSFLLLTDRLRKRYNNNTK